MTIKPLLHDKILDWTKLKTFADDKINVAEMMISLSDRVENIVGKEEKCQDRVVKLSKIDFNSLPNHKI